jgi:hypothetical protein
MVTTAITGRVGISNSTVCEMSSRSSEVEQQKAEPIARYRTPRGLTGLVVLIMDLLIRLDPR